MIDQFIELLIEEPLLLLFIISAIGYAIGRIKFKGISLGIAAVLFVGLAFGALSPEIKMPAAIFHIGLIIFVYTIGLSSGPGFFASFKRKGLRDNLFVVAVLLVAALITVGADILLGLKSTVTSGLYAGSLTNTPALAGVVESINATAPPDMAATMAAEPVIGYSVAYPMGVLGPILIIFLFQRLWKINYKEDAKRLRGFHIVEQELYNRTVRITQPQVIGVPIGELMQRYHWGAILGRTQRAGVISLATGDTVLQLGDLVSVIGTPEDVDAVVPTLGELSDEHLELDRSEYDFRRVFVSHPHLAGMKLSDLKLAQKYGALVTRVRRGDIDFLAHGDTVLELGDRVRVVARREQMKEISDLFGDSYKELSEVNLMSLGLGLTLGVLVGLIPIPLPGGVTLKLGLAGGPLVVGLVLGALRRTGPVVWTLPYSANLTLRQVGLILLLASIGVNAGYTFVTTLSEGGGVALFVAGAVITSATTLLAIIVSYKVLKIPFGMLTGMLAALHTQPAVLGFSLEQSDNELPNIGYALVYPMSTIAKIVIAQLLLRILA